MDQPKGNDHSHTRRHLTEFLHAEAEWNNIHSLEQHAAKLVDMLKCTLSLFLSHGEWRLKKLGQYEEVYKKVKMMDDIVMLDHKDAIRLCNEFGFYKEEGVTFNEEDDIPEAQERKLIDKIGKVVLLTRFHKKFKSFYMLTDPKEPDRVWGIDVEVPGVGEIIGSGVRESSADKLKQRLQESGLDPKVYECYTDLREYGFSFTSGMGLGIGRLMTWLLNVESIREVTAFPRFPGYAAP